jgi:hypothetical protein
MATVVLVYAATGDVSKLDGVTLADVSKINGVSIANVSKFNEVVVSSFINPTSLTFFRVNEDHGNDFDTDSADDAANYNGQSCYWKVYFDDSNDGSVNYDIIENSAVLMTITVASDCAGGYCKKWIDKCSSTYDGGVKTAYVVASGKTDTSEATSNSFTNSCTSSGNGDDGWDNNCNRTFDEEVIGGTITVTADNGLTHPQSDSNGGNDWSCDIRCKYLYGSSSTGDVPTSVRYCSAPYVYTSVDGSKWCTQQGGVSAQYGSACNCSVPSVYL